MLNISVFFVIAVLPWPAMATTADEDKKVEKYFTRMLKEQQVSMIVEVQNARLQRRATLSAEDKAKYWRLGKEYEVCLQGRANLPQHDVIRRAIAVPQGKSELTLPCPGYCRDPYRPKNAQWSYAKKGEFLEADEPVTLDENDNLITMEGDIILGDMKVKDSGLYFCGYEGHVMAVWLLEVIPETAYANRVGSLLPDIQKQTYDELNITAEIQTSPWAPCSRCHDVGKTFRYGICFLKSRGEWPQPEDHNGILRNEIRMLLQYRETGVPCRSEYMAGLLKDLPDIKDLKDFVQVKWCRTPCSSAEFVFYKSKKQQRFSKVTIASAVNGGVNTVKTEAPKKYTEKFWVPGNDLYLKCPGVESSEDVFWTKGQVPLHNIIREKSVFENRILVLENGRIMIRRPEEEDMGLYACYKWGQKEPTGAVSVKTRMVRKLIRTEVKEYIEEILLLVPLLLLLVAVILVACCTGMQHEEADTAYT